MHKDIMQRSGIDFKSRRIQGKIFALFLWELNGRYVEANAPQLSQNSDADKIIDLFFQNGHENEELKLEEVKNQLQVSWEQLLKMIS